MSILIRTPSLQHPGPLGLLLLRRVVLPLVLGGRVGARAAGRAGEAGVEALGALPRVAEVRVDLSEADAVLLGALRVDDLEADGALVEVGRVLRPLGLLPPRLGDLQPPVEFADGAEC